MKDARLPELAEFGIFRLPIHPVIEFIVELFLVVARQVLAFGRDDDFLQRFQLAVGHRRYGTDRHRRSAQFLRRKSLVVVVHDVNVPFKRHSRFENGRFGPGETEFQLGADDARLDERPTRFAHEIIVDERRDPHDPSGQTPDAHRIPDVVQVDVVCEFVALFIQF